MKVTLKIPSPLQELLLRSRPSLTLFSRARLYPLNYKTISSKVVKGVLIILSLISQRKNIKLPQIVP